MHAFQLLVFEVYLAVSAIALNLGADLSDNWTGDGNSYTAHTADGCRRRSALDGVPMGRSQVPHRWDGDHRPTDPQRVACRHWRRARRSSLLPRYGSQCARPDAASRSRRQRRRAGLIRRIGDQAGAGYRVVQTPLLVEQRWHWAHPDARDGHRRRGLSFRSEVHGQVGSQNRGARRRWRWPPPRWPSRPPRRPRQPGQPGMSSRAVRTPTARRRGRADRARAVTSRRRRCGSRAPSRPPRPRPRVSPLRLRPWPAEAPARRQVRMPIPARGHRAARRHLRGQSTTTFRVTTTTRSPALPDRRDHHERLAHNR